MTGDIIDSNSAMIAEKLLSIGLNVNRKVTIADNLHQLVDEINHQTQQADVLIINGGLGPTIDDLTAQALAKATESELIEHSGAKEHLISWATQRGIALDSANLKQATLPANIDIIANRLGSAVGFKVKHQNCDIYCTPGVPHELSAMLDETIIPIINKANPEPSLYKVVRYQVFGIGESKLQQLLNDQYPKWPDEVEIGFRAASPLLELKLTITNRQHEALLTHWQLAIEKLLGDHLLCCIGNNLPTMAEHVINELSNQNKTITTAESCTGGLIASLITEIPGSSKVFEAGFVTYSNAIKSQLLKVSQQTLEQHGAVSKEVVQQMARGALEQSKADYVIAVSGIAGPTGGTDEKPVGSVWIAWGSSSNISTRYFCIKGNRDYFQMAVATRGLDLIRRLLITSKEQPFYMNN